LVKKYGKNTVLKGIDLEIEEGDFFALLWHNGAWKTTAIWIMTDLVSKNSWTVEIFENNIDTDFVWAKKCVWVVPQEFNFSMWEKVKDIPVVQAWFYGIDKKTAEKRTKKLLKKLELWDHRDKESRELSWWMKRRLMIARALVHNPKFLILDEPTAWVDVELRKTMWNFIKELNASWMTILLTTHYLEEVEALCNKVAILSKWKIVENTSTHLLLQSLDEEVFVLDIVCEWDADSLLVDLKKFLPVMNPDCQLEVVISRKMTLNRLFEVLNKKSIHVKSMRNKVNRIEQLFMNLTK
jgi:ABC-2 type transport system ATP-binding protein